VYIGNGSISFDEFANLMLSHRSYRLSDSRDSLTRDALLRETFQVFDKDRDGYLNAEDLRSRIFTDVSFCFRSVCVAGLAINRFPVRISDIFINGN